MRKIELECFNSNEDDGYVARYGSLSGFGKTECEAWKELCVALSLALEVERGGK